ncbi:Flp pilus assembly protein CpaB [Comamonadaceae bacterium PP-2]
MNKTKVLAAFLIVLAVLLAAVAWMLSRQSAPVTSSAAVSTQQSTPVELFPVVVAAKGVQAGQVIGEADLKIIQLPARIPGSYAQISEVNGAVPMVDLTVEAPVFAQQLVQGFSTRVNEGERAISIKVDEAMAAGNRIQPGDFVDIYFTLDQQTVGNPSSASSANAQANNIDRQTRLLLSRKRVLAYGATSVEGPDVPRDQNDTPRAARNSQRVEAARTAVLAVPLADIERLSLGEQYGKLTLALRNPTDTAEPDPALFAQLPPALTPVVAPGQKTPPTLQGLDRAYAGLRFEDLAKGGGEPRKPPAPPRPVVRAASGGGAAASTTTQVEILRGGQSQTVRY